MMRAVGIPGIIATSISNAAIRTGSVFRPAMTNVFAQLGLVREYHPDDRQRSSQWNTLSITPQADTGTSVAKFDPLTDGRKFTKFSREVGVERLRPHMSNFEEYCTLPPQEQRSAFDSDHDHSPDTANVTQFDGSLFYSKRNDGEIIAACHAQTPHPFDPDPVPPALLAGQPISSAKIRVMTVLETVPELQNKNEVQAIERQLVQAQVQETSKQGMALVFSMLETDKKRLALFLGFNGVETHVTENGGRKMLWVKIPPQTLTPKQQDFFDLAM